MPKRVGCTSKHPLKQTKFIFDFSGKCSMATIQIGFIEVNSLCTKILEEFSKIYKVDVTNNLKRLTDYLEKFYRTELTNDDAVLNISYVQAVADTLNFNLESSAHFIVLKQYQNGLIA